MGVTVNHWLEEFDPLTRSQFLFPYSLMVKRRIYIP
jgi:hypothetical protein